MKCQLKYRWVKLPRACLPQGKGVLGQWARLAARAAYRKGVGLYCGFENPVEPGMWAGGVVGLKSILGIKSRNAALETLEQLWGEYQVYSGDELNPVGTSLPDAADGEKDRKEETVLTAGEKKKVADDE